MADPIDLVTEDDMVDFLRTLLHSGWRGKFYVSGEGEDFGVRIDMTKGDETVAVQLRGDNVKGTVMAPAKAIPMSNGDKYLQYTASDYDELQAILNPS